MKEKVIEIICSNLDSADMADLILKSNDLTEFGLNSLSFIKIIVKLEDEFGVEFNDDEINYLNYKSVDKILELVQNKIHSN